MQQSRATMARESAKSTYYKDVRAILGFQLGASNTATGYFAAVGAIAITEAATRLPDENRVNTTAEARAVQLSSGSDNTVRATIGVLSLRRKDNNNSEARRTSTAQHYHIPPAPRADLTLMGDSSR